MVTRSKANQIIFNILLYVFFVIILVVAILNKEGYHIDEIYTYGLANSYYEVPLGVQFEDGVTYEEPASIWMEYMTVPEWNDFNYGQVLDNQSMDVHPPMYYALVHTLSSFVPYSFSIWYSAIVNIVFAVLTLVAVQLLAWLLTEDNAFVKMVSVALVLCAGVISIATFLRMYVMTMFCVTLVADIVLWMYKKGFSILGVMILGAAAIMGALTHYYFLIYLFFTCLAYGLYLLYKKAWKEAVLLVLAMTGAGAVCLGVFPAMWTHMFGGGYRGTASVSNFTNVDLETNVVQLKQFYHLLNNDVFGGFLTLFVVGILCLVCAKKTEYNNAKKETLFGWILLLFPSIAYCLLVSRIAIYTTDRYITPVYAVILVGTLYAFYMAVEKRVSGRYVKPILGTMVVLMILGSFYNCQWPYLGQATGSFLKKAEEYSELDCIYIYETKWQTLYAYQEVASYDTLTFINVNNLGDLGKVFLEPSSEMIVLVESSLDAESILKGVQDYVEWLDEYEVIGAHGYTTTYHIY